MARIYVVEGATDMAAGATYSGGSAPTSGVANSLAWDRGNQIMTNESTALSGVNLNGLQINAKAAPRIANLVVGVTNGTKPRVIINGYGGYLGLNGDASNIAVVGNTTLRGIGGTWAKLFVRGNRSEVVYITSGCDLQELTVYDAHVIVESHASQILDKVHVIGSGRVDTARNIDKGRIAGSGRIIFRDGAKISDGAGGGVLTMLSDRAVAELLSKADITFDKIEAHAGLFETEGAGGNLTFTNAEISADFKIRERYSGGAVAYTNAPDYLGGDLTSMGGIGGAQ